MEKLWESHQLLRFLSLAIADTVSPYFTAMFCLRSVRTSVFNFPCAKSAISLHLTGIIVYAWRENPSRMYSIYNVIETWLITTNESFLKNQTVVRCSEKRQIVWTRQSYFIILACLLCFNAGIKPVNISTSLFTNNLSVYQLVYSCNIAII